jgi:ubiquitin-protein ligase
MLACRVWGSCKNVSCFSALSICDIRQTPHEGRLYELRVRCGDTYPDTPPEVRFISRINLNCVNQSTGEVVRCALRVLQHEGNASVACRRAT